MSYILDALRKADAQRERDPARGIHAQSASSPASGPARGSDRIVLWLVLGVVLAAAAAAALLWPRQGAQSPHPVPAPLAAAPVPAAPVAANQLQPPPPPMPVVQAAPPAPVARPQVAAKAQRPASRAQAPASAAVAAASAPVAAASASAAAPINERILNPAEVPDLPKLAVSGGVYSDNPGQRMLIVGGQVVNEGAEIAPGVKLEQIRPKSALVRFRGLKVAIPY